MLHRDTVKTGRVFGKRFRGIRETQDWNWAVDLMSGDQRFLQLDLGACLSIQLYTKYRVPRQLTLINIRLMFWGHLHLVFSYVPQLLLCF